MTDLRMEESQEVPRISDIMPSTNKNSQNTYFGRVSHYLLQHDYTTVTLFVVFLDSFLNVFIDKPLVHKQLSLFSETLNGYS